MILGRFYLGFTHPNSDYITFQKYSVGETIYFYNPTDFDILTSSNITLVTQNFKCNTVYYLGDTSIPEYEKTHPLNEAYFIIKMNWDWGRFRIVTQTPIVNSLEND